MQGLGEQGAAVGLAEVHIAKRNSNVRLDSRTHRVGRTIERRSFALRKAANE